MRDYKLCNLVFDHEGFFNAYPQIALRVVEGHAQVLEDGTLSVGGDVDFTTFLNSISFGK